MHRLRKRKSHPDEAGTPYGTEENGGSCSESRNMAGPANKMDEKEDSIVISDSDSSELEEGGISQKQKAFHRKTLAVKRKIARMTEEEQLALAVKISQQEQANHVKHRQEEDELLRKAIEESLHGCTGPDKSTAVAVQDLTKDVSSSEEDIALDEQPKEHMSQQSQIVGQDSPKVLLKRLSQDIVESPSVILSPNCKDPLSCTESCNVTSLSQSNSIDLDYMSPSKAALSPVFMSPSKAALSPVFPVKSPYTSKIKPCRLFQDRSPSAVKLSDEVESLHCSESTHLDSSSLVPNSNTSELTDGASSSHNVGICLKGSSIVNASVNNMDVLPKRTCQSSTTFKLANKKQNDSSVHYYWGIPFCPNGEDPNAYTQVILCQLEVYEKSLKKSQRQLLRKTGYSEPVDLTVSSEGKELVKYNQDNLSQEDTEEIIEGGDQQKLRQNEMETADETDSSDIQPIPSKRSKASCSPFQEDDHSCPSEGQVKSSSQELSTNLLPSECEGVAPEVLVESPISPAIIRDENCPNSEMPVENTQEESVCPETQLSSVSQDNGQEIQPDISAVTPVCSQARSTALYDARGPPITEVQESDNVDQSCSAEESARAESPAFSLSDLPPDMMTCEEPACSDVECPMCGCRFSSKEIEHHAAYCDGVKDESQKTVLRPRNRQSRQTHNGLHDSAASSDSSKLEKCYLCKSQVPLKDYTTHVDRCLQSAALETPENPRLKSYKETAEREGRLLSMLEQSESISADENNTAFLGMSPPREELADCFDSNHLSINDSPIRSFVSISEATDCLVDFKKQFSRPPKRQLIKKGTKHRGNRRRM